MSEAAKFDLELVQREFSDCFEKEGLGMAAYLRAYRELNKLVKLLGTVFGFVSSDIEEKISILEEFMESKTKEHYESIGNMIHHERTSGKLDEKDFVSGSRTLLRLHRALAFIVQFLEGLIRLEGGDWTTSVGREAYKNTLAHHHPWLVRKTVGAVLYMLPTKGQLGDKCKGDDQMIQQVILHTNKVFQKTQELFVQYEAENLP